MAPCYRWGGHIQFKLVTEKCGKFLNVCKYSKENVFTMVGSVNRNLFLFPLGLRWCLQKASGHPRPKRALFSGQLV